MTIFQTALLSFIEGLTEFLPVSSTAHLILTSQLLGIPQTEAHKSFEIAIQLGAILAVVVLYARTLIQQPRMILLAIAGFMPTGIIGFLLYDTVKNVFLESIPMILWSLLLGGIVLIAFEYFRPSRGEGDLSRMTLKQAVLVGVFQSVSMIPGVPRAAATIIGGEIIGIPRKAIVEYSFLLAIPTMAMATGYDLWKTAGEFSAADLQMLAMGFALSFVFALVAVRWFIAYVKKHSFTVFGVYRIAVALLFWVLLS